LMLWTIARSGTKQLWLKVTQMETTTMSKSMLSAVRNTNNFYNCQ
jgi:hypothetical protein